MPERSDPETAAAPRTLDGGGRWLLGCVADNNQRFRDQSLALVRSRQWFGGDAADCDFIACVVDSAERSYIDELSCYGADVRIVSRYSREYPVTNKLRFFQQPDLSRYDHILLLDCDTLVVQNPLPALKSDRFQAKMVPRRRIPHEVFEKLFRSFDVPISDPDYECSVTKEPSIPYFNTGVLCVHKAQMANLVPAWIQFVDRLLDRPELIAGLEWFIEQVALSLALAATASEFQVLGNEMNFQIHMGPKHVYEPRLKDIDPRIIHYHKGVTGRGEIARTAYPLVSARIDMFNQRVREERKLARATARPAMGAESKRGDRDSSEPTDRGLIDRAKARTFEALGKPDGRLGIWLAGHREYAGGEWLAISKLQFEFMLKMGLKPGHVLLDIGCGPLRGGVEFISYLNPGNYFGLDSSKRLIQLGKRDELGRHLLRLKSPKLVVSRNFEFEKFPKKPNLAIAHSLFTHLNEPDIRLCFEKLRAFVNPGCRFYATYSIDTPHANQSIRSHSHRSFHYSRATVEDFGVKAGWRQRYIGDWGHPRHQMMVEYVAE